MMVFLTLIAALLPLVLAGALIQNFEVDSILEIIACCILGVIPSMVRWAIAMSAYDDRKGVIITGFRTGARAKCWQVEPKGRFTKVRLSTSRKNRDTGEYEQDFSGFISFIGNANAKAQNLKVNDTIILDEVEVTTNFDKQKNREYVNYACYSYKTLEEAGFRNNNTGNTAQSSQNTVDSGEVDEAEETPF